MAHLLTVAPVSITANPQTVTLPSSVAAGSLIVVHVAQYYGANPPRDVASVADNVNAGNYTLTGSQSDANLPIAIYHKIAESTGTPTVSVSFTGGVPNGSISVSVYDSAHTTPGPTNQAAVATGPTSTAGAVDTGANSALRISMYGTFYNYYTLADTGSGTARAFQSINAAGPNNVYVADRVVSGSVAHSVSFSPDNASTALTVSFTGSGGGFVPRSLLLGVG